jgi:aminopeptidase-like protein
MSIQKEFEQRAATPIGEELHRFAAELFPLCRSITGDGLRQTLQLIQKRISLKLHEVPSGTQVFDWTVPKEWNIRDAYLRIPGGERVIDFRRNNLHVLNYSAPIRKTMSLGELKPHLFSIPDHPEWIPYRTSYYKEDWGFCLSHRDFLALQEREYEVCIDSTLADGHLTYGEFYLPGQTTEEVLISCHTCHPSLANDNLSGLSVATCLAEQLAKRERRYSYRFLFIPGTIGAITWLALHRDAAQKIVHGLVLTCIGDSGGFHYKKSRRGDAEIDRAVSHVLRHQPEPHELIDFSPYGYDERQYCSPGFNLAVGCLMRSVWGRFPEYHSSADNLEFIKPAQLAGSLQLCAGILDVLEGNVRYRNANPFCEPQLGKRGLYPSTGGTAIDQQIHARLWVLNLSDGQNSLLDIAERAQMPFPIICEAADVLLAGGLLSLCPSSSPENPPQTGFSNRTHGDPLNRLV